VSGLTGGNSSCSTFPFKVRIAFLPYRFERCLRECLYAHANLHIRNQ
jgi:hypothetical protein